MPRALCHLAVAPLFAAALLTACQTPAAPPTTGTAMTDSDARVRIQGEAMYLEKILLPAEARLRLQLVDERLADTADAVVAEQVTTVGNGPYEFAIDVPRARMRADGQYGLHAAVLMPDGGVRFQTNARVPLTIEPDSTDLHLGRVRLHHVQPD